MWHTRMEVGDNDDDDDEDVIQFLLAVLRNSPSPHDHHSCRWKFSHSLLGDAPVGRPSSFLR